MRPCNTEESDPPNDATQHSPSSNNCHNRMGVNVSMPPGEGENNHWLDFFKQPAPLEIVPPCRVVKLISWNLLWENFLNSECQSFAVNETELSALLEASYLEGTPR